MGGLCYRAASGAHGESAEVGGEGRLAASVMVAKASQRYSSANVCCWYRVDRETRTFQDAIRLGPCVESCAAFFESKICAGSNVFICCIVVFILNTSEVLGISS